ncbi:hypothetical protein F5148DRAFT_387388 [Russula earlei]|uniref:Uncharacterized protein n=1 Tax=Russula earlei TaxID=71964 RepID=A0ACC0U2J1_9AGAM|nr:hypothetical protein F5148DRAFT_387388 [Russula earlei]
MSLTSHLSFLSLPENPKIQVQVPCTGPIPASNISCYSFALHGRGIPTGSCPRFRRRCCLARHRVARVAWHRYTKTKIAVVSRRSTNDHRHTSVMPGYTSWGTSCCTLCYVDSYHPRRCPHSTPVPPLLSYHSAPSALPTSASSTPSIQAHPKPAPRCIGDQSRYCHSRISS